METRQNSHSSSKKILQSRVCWERNWFGMKWKWDFSLYNWLHWTFCNERSRTCGNIVCHSAATKSNVPRNTRTPLPMHANVAVKERLRILPFNFRWMSLTRSEWVDWFFHRLSHSVSSLFAESVLLPSTVSTCTKFKTTTFPVTDK